MKNNVLIVLSRLLYITTVIGDITTVYKFNSIHSALESPRYLNSCTVSVHVEGNDLGLPLFNKNGNRSLFKTIPPLYSGTNETRWRTLARNGTLLPVSSFQSNAPDSLNIFKWKPSITNRLIEIHEKIHELHSKIIKNDDDHVFEEGDMNSPNTFLRLRFKEQTATQQGILSHFCFRSNGGGNGCLKIKFASNHSFTVFFSPYTSKTIYSSTISYGFMKDTQALVYMGVQEYNREFILFDGNNLISHKIMILDEYYEKLSLIKHRYSYKLTYGDPVSYDLVQFDPVNLINPLVSPWLDIKKNTSLFILYYSMINNFNQTLSVYIEEELTGNIQELQCQEIDQMDLIKYYADNDEDINDRLERVLLKVNVLNMNHWKGQKRIVINSTRIDVLFGNVWEGNNQPVVYFGKNNCIKSDFDELYTVPVDQEDNLDHQLTCYNEGLLDNSRCRCPPGFSGDQCETPCGRNLFGQNCFKSCSKTPTECQGIILCTPSHGCSCAPGYHGDQCLHKCSEGFYGADCKQNCSHWCESGCDIYTGVCQGKCKLPYSFGPNCNQFHSYLKEAPQIIGSSFHSVKININLTVNNTVKSSDNTMFYMVQYREDSSTTWNNCSLELFNGSIFSYEVEGLKPGILYFFRVLLIDETLQTHDPDLAKVSKGYTHCINTVLGSDFRVTRTTNTSITLTWTELGKHEKTECSCVYYILEVEDTGDDHVETREIINIKTNIFEIKNLSPSQTHHIILKKLTVHGERIPIADIDVTTDDAIDLSHEIPGVRMTRTDSHFEFKWFPSAKYKVFYVKCKLRRHMSCNNEKNDFPLKVAVTNSTSYNLSYDNLEHFAEYQVFVTADKNQGMKLNNISLITKGKLPEDSPTLLKQKERIGNDSAVLFWTNISFSCQKINGVFKTYLIELYDMHNMHVLRFKTTDNHLLLKNLQPETQYSLKIRYVNHLGFNPTKYAEYNFTTKSTNLFVPQELTVYKKGLNILGLRWKWPETNSTITGFNIVLESEPWNKSISGPSNLNNFRCDAWPSYICFDVNNLKPDIRYSITVNIFNKEFPIGEGHSSPIDAITQEDAPLSVSDIRLEHFVEKDMTLSWKIPFLLNGILRKFAILVEHRFDGGVTLLNHTVTREQERYSHVLTNVYGNASYTITIWAFTKIKGPPEIKMFVTPPFK